MKTKTKHWLIKELFRSNDDKIYMYWITTAINEEEARDIWRKNYETNWNEFETSSGNLRIFESAESITEDEFIMFKCFFPELLRGE